LTRRLRPRSVGTMVGGCENQVRLCAVRNERGRARSTLRLAALVLATLAGISPALPQTWTQTGAPSNHWAGIAASADGTRLVAVGGSSRAGPGSIYTSTDAGNTWVSNNAPKLNWIAVCSSADGSRLAAVAYNSSGVWTNSGQSWAQTASPLNLFYPSSIASSADGSRLIALTSTALISTNFGRSWTPNPTVGGEGCAASAAGLKMLALGSNPYVSTNAGVSWTNYANLLWEEFRAAASSADGTTLAALADAGVWHSTNSGVSWMRSADAPTSSYGSIASSADGARLILAQGFSVPTPLYVSTDSGTTWTSANAPSNAWQAVASAADGNTLVAAVNGGGIWISRTPPAPRLYLVSANDSLVFSWTLPSASFVLQQSSDLVHWMPVSNTPTLNLMNLQYGVSFAPSNTSDFYRLAAP